MTDDQLLERNRRIHFYRRVHERIGPHVDAKTLWNLLVDLIEAPNPDHLVFVTRLNRHGRRLWKFRLEGCWRFVVFDHQHNHPVTILEPNGRINRQGKPPIDMRTHT